MRYGNNSREKYSYGVVTDTTYERFREEIGLPQTGGPPEPSLEALRAEIGTVPTGNLAAMGQAIREDLSEPLDGEFIADTLAEIAEQFDRFEELRQMGAPSYGETPYMEMTEAAWELNEHLAETGFFACVEQHLPSFTPEHIETTTKQLLQIASLTETLSALGFPEDEQIALVTNIVNSSSRLSWWGKSDEYPTAESYDERDDKPVEGMVSPLQERAMTGSLLWMRGLDWRLWQYQILLTDDIIEKGVWDVKSMLAGVYLMGDAARGLADGTISDENLTTLLSASTAIMLIGQELIAEDVARIKDEHRKPREEIDLEKINFED